MRREATNFWQSYADVAMGVMAVMILVLILVLVSQRRANGEFIEELLRTLEDAQGLQTRQDEVKGWVNQVFRRSDCELELDAATGALKYRDAERAAELYQSGSVQLGAEGARVIRKCADAFLTLAFCLGEKEDDQQICTSRMGDAMPDPGVLSAFREGIDALTLQGNTDKEPYPSERRPRVLRDSRAPDVSAFVSNGDLGTERAREALAHLLVGVEQHAREATDIEISQGRALSLLMHHLRIESPSFGRYQAGEAADWHPSCASGPRCEAARNLALQLEWKEASLRSPFNRLERFFCERWLMADEALRRSVKAPEKADRLCERYRSEPNEHPDT